MHVNSGQEIQYERVRDDRKKTIMTNKVSHSCTREGSKGCTCDLSGTMNLPSFMSLSLSLGLMQLPLALFLTLCIHCTFYQTAMNQRPNQEGKRNKYYIQKEAGGVPSAFSRPRDRYYYYSSFITTRLLSKHSDCVTLATYIFLFLALSVYLNGGWRSN